MPITLADEQGHAVRSRVVSAEVAERVGYLFLGMAAAARARGEQTALVDLDEVVLVAPVEPGVLLMRGR
ncbi:hypothetical protein [Actinomycetospora callitridis]|uniref:hypothetical protein n=1 Tax=Actinomycetospora callitridis TaxID=913944 RepID=UPI0023669085|nr:hypothetical protein [Actinomycetospora callitridis]MDD7918268.1 hypothetical protein [Actinomycetospora callitridis]